jgi:hypothetical protein
MIKYKNTKIIDVYDWDKLVKETYKRPYNFQQQGGCKDRGTYEITIPEPYNDDEFPETIPEIINGEEMGVKFSSWLVRDPKEWNGKPKSDKAYLHLFWQRNFYPNIHMIANDLYNKGLIEPGDYTIKIDW